MKPSVSIVTPSYNQAEFIGETIESVRRQTYDDVTHVVVDGESDDGTLEILRRHDSHLDWTSEPDEGQADAINMGFDRADGDIVGWLNSDDPYVYRSVVADVVEVFERTDADVVFGHAITIDRDNVLRRVHYIPRFDAAKLRRHCYLIQPSVFFRGHVVDEYRLNSEREYSMDYEFWLDLAGEYTFRRFDGVVAADRNHPNRKIIADAEGSAADTSALRRERNIDTALWFRLMQVLDSGELRLRRLRSLPLLAELLEASPEQFAFDLETMSLLRTLRTQLVGKKKGL